VFDNQGFKGGCGKGGGTHNIDVGANGHNVHRGICNGRPLLRALKGDRAREVTASVHEGYVVHLDFLTGLPYLFDVDLISDVCFQVHKKV
jgi:hypothetical protein